MINGKVGNYTCIYGFLYLTHQLFFVVISIQKLTIFYGKYQKKLLGTWYSNCARDHDYEKSFKIPWHHSWLKLILNKYTTNDENKFFCLENCLISDIRISSMMKYSYVKTMNI